MKIKVKSCKDYNKFNIEFDSTYENKICTMLKTMFSLSRSEILDEPYNTDDDFIEDEDLKITSVVNIDGYKVSIMSYHNYSSAFGVNHVGEVHVTIDIRDRDNNGVELTFEKLRLRLIIGLFKNISSIHNLYSALKEVNDRLRPLNIKLYSASKNFYYKFNHFCKVTYLLENITEDDKKNDCLIRHRNSLNLYDFCKQLIVLGYNDGESFYLSKIDNVYGPCKMEISEEGHVAITV